MGDIRRREFITLLGGAAAWPVAARAQQAAKVARIGMLATGSLASPEFQVIFGAFRQGLRQLGYVEGQNIFIEYRAADGAAEQLSNLAMDLVRLNVDLIVAPNTLAARAARQATTTIPIVAPAMADAVEDGLVSSLAQPGRNVTGLTFLGRELNPKRLQLLKDVLPAISRVAVLWHQGAFGERAISDTLQATEAAARALDVQVQPVRMQSTEESDGAFAIMTRNRAEAMIVLPSPILYNARRRIADLARTHRLPSMFGAREYVELGGLISYGANIPDLMRRGAIYADKVLKGAEPAHLPVEQATKFELVINLKTAKALGLIVPDKLLALADEVTE